jgi:hypothetical protein
MRKGEGALNEHMITWNGKTQNAKAWAAEIGGIRPQKLLNRVLRVESGEVDYDLDRAMNPKPLQRGWTPITRKRHPIRVEMAAAINVPYWADDWVWYVTHVHPDGLTLDQVGEFYGLTRERIRQIENGAMRKVRKAAELKGKSVDLRELLSEMDHVRSSNQNALGSGGDTVAA